MLAGVVTVQEMQAQHTLFTALTYPHAHLPCLHTCRSTEVSEQAELRFCRAVVRGRSQRARCISR